MKQYYEKLVTLKAGHEWEGQGKNKTKNLNIVDIHSIEE
jgi:hypothetical protein